MNFSPFGSPFPASIHQFAASGLVSSATNQIQDTVNRYHGSSANIGNMPHFNQSHTPILSKFRNDDSANQHSMNKYNSNNGANNGQYTGLSVPYTSSSQTPAHDDKHRISSNNYQQPNSTHPLNHVQSELSQDLCNAILNQQQNDAKRVLQNVNTGWQSLAPSSAVADYLSHLPSSTLPLSLHHFLKYSAESIKKEAQNPLSTVDMSHNQNIAQGFSGSGLLSNVLLNQGQSSQHQQQQQQQQHPHPHPHPHPQQQQPQQQQHQEQQMHNNQNGQQHQVRPHPQMNGTTLNIPQAHQQQPQNRSVDNATVAAATTAEATSTNGTANATTGKITAKKKKKKKPPKEKKPRPKPGEIRLTTALDGSTLFCCPECQMAYPERGLLEQHLVGHNLERRFICDICNAALKRKDHLTRHKQSHNPERPFVCTICMKAFKRKEQLTLHFVIHSGEKRHICNECGKGFYRKDHLRKHTRSHIARRVKAELSQHHESPNLVAAQQLQQQQQQQQQQSTPQTNSQQVPNGQHQQLQQHIPQQHL